MIYAICDEQSGRIDRFFRSESKNRAALQVAEGEAMARVIGEPTHDRYRNQDTGKLRKRPETPCVVSRTEVPADGATHVAMSQMRPGTQIEIAGPVSMSFVAEQSSEQITFTVPGEYTLTATGSWPAQPKTVTIHAT